MANKHRRRSARDLKCMVWEVLGGRRSDLMCFLAALIEGKVSVIGNDSGVLSTVPKSVTRLPYRM